MLFRRLLYSWNHALRIVQASKSLNNPHNRTTNSRFMGAYYVRFLRAHVFFIEIPTRVVRYVSEWECLSSFRFITKNRQYFGVIFWGIYSILVVELPLTMPAQQPPTSSLMIRSWIALFCRVLRGSRTRNRRIIRTVDVRTRHNAHRTDAWLESPDKARQ